MKAGEMGCPDVEEWFFRIVRGMPWRFDGEVRGMLRRVLEDVWCAGYVRGVEAEGGVFASHGRTGKRGSVKYDG